MSLKSRRPLRQMIKPGTIPWWHSLERAAGVQEGHIPPWARERGGNSGAGARNTSHPLDACMSPRAALAQAVVCTLLFLLVGLAAPPRWKEFAAYPHCADDCISRLPASRGQTQERHNRVAQPRRVTTAALPTPMRWICAGTLARQKKKNPRPTRPGAPQPRPSCRLARAKVEKQKYPFPRPNATAAYDLRPRCLF